jgi:hypothetical protein
MYKKKILKKTFDMEKISIFNSNAEKVIGKAFWNWIVVFPYLIRKYDDVRKPTIAVMNKLD